MSEFKCFVCNKSIIEDRVKFLIESGVAPQNFTCTPHSVTSKIKGVYTGEHGTSDIILCDKVYDDSVKTVFKAVEKDEDEDTEPTIDL